MSKSKKIEVYSMDNNTQYKIPVEIVSTLPPPTKLILFVDQNHPHVKKGKVRIYTSLDDPKPYEIRALLKNPYIIAALTSMQVTYQSNGNQILLTIFLGSVVSIEHRHNPDGLTGKLLQQPKDSRLVAEISSENHNHKMLLNLGEKLAENLPHGSYSFIFSGFSQRAVCSNEFCNPNN